MHLYVGPERKKFTVHKDLACDRSEYIKMALEGNFQESKEGLYLPDDDVGAFELFLSWMYGGEVHLYVTAENIGKYLVLLALSEKLIVERLHNQTIDAIREFYWRRRESVQTEHLVYVFENIKNSRLHDAIAHHAADQLLERNVGSLVPSFQEMLMDGGAPVVAVVENLVRNARGHDFNNCTVMAWNHSCAYHTHVSTPTCAGPDILYDRLTGPRLTRNDHLALALQGHGNASHLAEYPANSRTTSNRFRERRM